MKGTSVRIMKVRFGSFLKWNLYLSIAAGVFFGVTLFVVSLFGGDVKANLGQSQYNGMIGGVISLFISPFIFALFGVISGLLLYLPFLAAMKFTKGIQLTGLFEIKGEEQDDKVEVEE